MKQFICKNEEDTIEFCKFLSGQIDNLSEAIITLEGDLGAGKTFISAKTIAILLNKPNLVVQSPTFTIINCYENKINHYDLYRLKTAQELEIIGFYESLFNKITFIEWPQLATAHIAQFATLAPHVAITIKQTTLGERVLVINFPQGYF